MTPEHQHPHRPVRPSRKPLPHRVRGIKLAENPARYHPDAQTSSARAELTACPQPSFPAEG